MKNFKFLLFVVLCSILLAPLKVLAKDGTVTVKLNSNNANTVVSALNGVVSEIASKGSGEHTVILYESALDNISKSDRKDTINSLMIAVNKTSIDESDKSKINNALADMMGDTSMVIEALDSNVSEELDEAISGYGFLSQWINPVLGFLTYGLVVLFVLSTVIDILYLCVEPIAMILRRKDKRPWGVSREAVKAEKECDECRDIRNVLLVYGKHRAVIMICVLLIILYMIRGTIFSKVGELIDLFSGF